MTSRHPVLIHHEDQLLHYQPFHSIAIMPANPASPSFHSHSPSPPSRGPVPATTTIPLLEPYTTHPTPTLLFFNPRAKGNYFLPSGIQQGQLLLDGVILLMLPFYAIVASYHWTYSQQQSQAGGDGAAVLSALVDSVCGVLHLTVIMAYLVVVLSLFSVRSQTRTQMLLLLAASVLRAHTLTALIAM